MTARASTFRSARDASPEAPLSSIGTGRLPLAVVLYFLMIALPIQFNLGPVFMTGVRAVLLVTTIPLTIRLFSGRLGRVLPTDVLLLAYILWAIAMLFVNSPSQVVSIGGSYALELFGSYILARNYIRTPEQFRAMCRGLFTVLIFTVPFAIYETQSGRPLITEFIAKLPGISSYADYSDNTFGSRLGLERSQVIFSHPIHYGLFCSSLFSLALAGFSGLVGNFRRYLLGFLISIGVVASVSSGAILPVALQLGLMVWAWTLRNVPSRWIILSVLVTFCYVVVDLISNRTGIEVFLSYTALSPETAYGRIIIFKWGMVNVWKSPLIGIGLNDWERPWWLATSVDNFWLLATMRYGIPGFFLLAAAYLTLVWNVMRRDLGSGGPVWQFRRAWGFIQVSMILTLCTVDIWGTALSYVFFLFGSAGWLVSAQAKPVEAQPTVALSVDRTSQRYTRFSWTKVR